MHDVMEQAAQTAKPPPLGISDILDPIQPETFLSEYWGRRSLHIPGPSKNFGALLNRKSYIRWAAEADSLEAWIANKERTKNAGVTKIMPRQIDTLYDAGFTICARGIDKGSATLTALGRRVKTALNYTGNIDFRAYLSGDGSGATTHFDARHATTLQIEGEKVWRYAVEPSVQFPPGNAVLKDLVPEYIRTAPVARVRDLALEPALSAPPPDLEFREVTLRPGDVLYLAPGTWHSAQAVGHSLAVNMAFNYGGGGTALEMAADLVYMLLYADPKWRMTAPLVTASQGGAMPEPVRRFFAERLDDLRQALDGLAPDDPRLETIWRTRVGGK